MTTTISSRTGASVTTRKPAKGLGKGLSALLSEEYSQHATTDSVPRKEGQVSLLELGAVRSGRFQPRTHFDNAYLEELAQSIQKNGVMQPILVRPLLKEEGIYEIIAGERRWRAAKLAGLETIPAIIREVEDRQAMELALVENVQRQDLSPLDEAAGYQRLIDEFAYTQEALATTVGKSRSHIANLLRLLTLPDAIKKLMNNDKITMGHARALLNAEDPVTLAEEVVRRGLNVRQTENLVRDGQPGQKKTNKTQNSRIFREEFADPTNKDADIIALEQMLSESLGLKVSIHDQGNSGDIRLHYTSLAQLDDILRRLGGGVL